MPTASSYPSIEIPNIDIFALLFEDRKTPFPDDKIIYIDSETDRSYTWAQVKIAALDFGKGLKSIWEWRKGDVLGIFSPNTIDIPAVIWGTLWAGGVVSPANPAYTAGELAYQLKDAGAKALVTQKAQLKAAREAAVMAGIPEDRIILVGDARDELAKFKHFSSVRNTTGTSRYRKARIDSKNNLAFLVYSSGTTGRPKGVMLTHSNIVANVLQGQSVECEDLTWNGGKDGTGDRVLGFLPFFHIYGESTLPPIPLKCC